jgi:hypothetical protein
MAYNRLKLREALLIRGNYLQDFVVYCLPLCCLAVAQEQRQVLRKKSSHVPSSPRQSSVLQAKPQVKHTSSLPFDANSLEVEEGPRQVVHNFLISERTQGDLVEDFIEVHIQANTPQDLTASRRPSGH